jgi:hypothetical protein
MSQSNQNPVHTNEPSGRAVNRVGVLSTISSVGSVEDGDETEIEDHPGPAQDNKPSKEESSDETATEDNPGVIPRSIFGFARPFARKSTSSTIRSSTASSAGLAIAAEARPAPDLPHDGAAARGSNFGISDAETVAPRSRRASDAPSAAARARSNDASQTNPYGGRLLHSVLEGTAAAAAAGGEKPSLVASVDALSRAGSGGAAPSTDPLSQFEWDTPAEQRAKSFVTRWFVEWWLLEIISWVFSAICMSIILSVLLHFNRRPLPAWKLGLTLNSFISILSGFAKASLLLPTAQALGQLKWNWFRKPRQLADFEIIDSASRGPLGSMVLLASTKGMYVSCFHG